jgi:hypothetical protein
MTLLSRIIFLSHMWLLIERKNVKSLENKAGQDPDDLFNQIIQPTQKSQD